MSSGAGKHEQSQQSLLHRVFGRLSIRASLNTIALGAAFVALFVACIATLVFEVETYRNSLVDRLTLLANVIGENSAAAIVFQDPQNATETLRALEAEADVLAAAIYDVEGKVFASFERRTSDQVWPPPHQPTVGAAYHDGKLWIGTPIQRDGQRLGLVYLVSTLDALYDRIRTFSGIVALIFVISAVLAYLIARILREVLLQPIEELVDTANDVAESSNYTIRADVVGGGELRALIHHFNEMLATIEADADLKAAHEKAIEATRLKNEFLANMSHELRTPLNAIIGYSEMLLEDCAADAPTPPPPEDLSADLRRIHDAGHHLLSLINDVLDFSKIEAQKIELYPETVKIEELLAQIAEMIQPLANKNNNTLTVSADPSVETITADITRLRQILFNLLSNACKFTENGQVELRCAKASDQISFTVIDEGIGIEADKLQRIFQPFEQADASTTRKYGGTGLGLVICARLSELMGGRIDVESEPGRGSRFRLSLPTTPTHTAREPESFAGEMRTVLIVDDDPEARILLARILDKEDIATATAATGDEALAVAKDIQPDAITLDIRMPNPDGWNVLTQLKQESSTRRIPIIVVSMLDDDGTAKRHGADGFVTKPVERRLLLEQLHAAWSTRRG